MATMPRLTTWVIPIVTLWAFPLYLPAQAPAPQPISDDAALQLRLLEDGTLDEQIDAAHWLGDHREPLAVPLLLKCLRGPDNVLWGVSATALAKIGNPVAIVPLVNALEAETAALDRGESRINCGTRHFIVRALHRLTGMRFGHNLERWKELRNRLTRSS
jgi:hypothetical protein